MSNACSHAPPFVHGPRNLWNQLIVAHKSELVPVTLPPEAQAINGHRGQNLAFLGDRLLDVHLCKLMGLTESDAELMGQFTTERNAVMSNESLATAAEVLLVPVLFERELLLGFSERSRATCLEAIVGRLSEVAAASEFEAAMREVVVNLCGSHNTLGSSTATFRAIGVGAPSSDNLGFRPFPSPRWDGVPVENSDEDKQEAWKHFMQRLSKTQLEPRDFETLSSQTGGWFSMDCWDRRFTDGRSVCIIELRDTTESSDVLVSVLEVSDESLSQARLKASQRLIEACGLKGLAAMCNLPAAVIEGFYQAGRSKLPARIFMEHKQPKMAVSEAGQWLGAEIKEDLTPTHVFGHFDCTATWLLDDEKLNGYGSGAGKKAARAQAYQHVLEQLKHLHDGRGAALVDKE